MKQTPSKTALFIDGAHLYASAKSIGLDLDYRLLLTFFENQVALLRAYYYIAIAEGDEKSAVRPLANFLEYNGYTVVTKSSEPFTDATGRRKIKRNLAVKLVVDAMELAPHIDQIVLLAGDAEFAPLVTALQRRGKHVTIVSTVSTSPVMITEDLRRVADEFVDLTDFQAQIARNPLDRQIKKIQTR